MPNTEEMNERETTKVLRSRYYNGKLMSGKGPTLSIRPDQLKFLMLGFLMHENDQSTGKTLK